MGEHVAHEIDPAAPEELLRGARDLRPDPVGGTDGADVDDLAIAAHGRLSFPGTVRCIVQCALLVLVPAPGEDGVVRRSPAAGSSRDRGASPHRRPGDEPLPGDHRGGRADRECRTDPSGPLRTTGHRPRNRTTPRARRADPDPEPELPPIDPDRTPVRTGPTVTPTPDIASRGAARRTLTAMDPHAPTGAGTPAEHVLPEESDPALLPHATVRADGTLGGVADLTGLHPNAANVATVLAGLGVAGRVRELPDRAATAVAAAELLGIEVGAVANSLVFDADGEPLLVMTSGAHRADVLALATLVGASRVKRADADFVRAATGQPIGGVAPVGHPRPLRTVVDVELARYPAVWAAGGHPHYVFPTTYDELLRITAGEAAEVGEQPA